MAGTALLSGRTHAKVIALPNPKAARKAFTARFLSAWQDAVGGIIEAARVVIEAKRELEHGQFLDWVDRDLGLGARTAQKLMVIASHPVLSNAAHWAAFPPS